MPKSAARSSLEGRILEIIARASAAVIEAVRADVPVQISRPRGGAPNPTPKRTPVAKKSVANKPAPVKPPAAPSPPQPASPTTRKPHPHRSYTDADVEQVIALITAKPGLRGEDIKAAASGIAPLVVQKILENLRARGRVKTNGIKRAMTYAVTGDAKPAPADKPAKKTSPETRTKPKSTRRAANSTRGRAAAAEEPVAVQPAPVNAPTPPMATPPPVEPAAPAKDVDAGDAILAVIRENPGIRAEQIRERLALSAAQVTTGLEKLRGAERVRSSGKARGTSYTAV